MLVRRQAEKMFAHCSLAGFRAPTLGISNAAFPDPNPNPSPTGSLWDSRARHILDRPFYTSISFTNITALSFVLRPSP